MTAPVSYKFSLFSEYIQHLQSIPLSTASRHKADAILKEKIPEAPVRSFLLTNLVTDPDTEKYKWKLNLEGIQEGLSG